MLKLRSFALEAAQELLFGVGALDLDDHFSVIALLDHAVHCDDVWRQIVLFGFVAVERKVELIG